MDPKTKMTIAIVAGLVGAFVLGGIAFGVGAPVLGRMHAAAFDARADARDGDWQGAGPRAWNDGAGGFQRGPGMMDGRGQGMMGGQGTIGPRGQGMLGPRGQAPADPRSGTGAPPCPNCDDPADCPRVPQPEDSTAD